MHAYGTRALQLDRRWSEAIRWMAALAAVLFWALFFALIEIGPAFTAASTASVERAPETPVFSDNVAHEVRLQSVSPGGEALELSARMTEDGGLIQRPVTWIVRDAAGEIVMRSNAPVAATLAMPGEYEVEAIYGAVRLKRPVSLPPGQKLSVVFTLNVGGIRVLPRVAGIGLPSTPPSFTTIYAASGSAAGKLVGVSEMPGEIIRVGSGAYRVESRFSPGNVLAIAEVTVKAGRMSAVEIDHPAGLAHLMLQPADERVSWTITDEMGDELPPVGGAVVDVVLKPGRYSVRAALGEKVLNREFTITAGQSQDIVLGN